MSDNRTQTVVQVPETWLKSLLELAEDFSANQEKYEHGNYTNDRVYMKAVMLAGYARSTKSVLTYNPKTEIKV